MKAVRKVVCLPVLFSLFVSQNALSDEFYLSIPGVRGEATRQTHAGEIELVSIGYFLSPGSNTAQNFQLSKFTDSASADIFAFVTQGTPVPSATLTVHSANERGGHLDRLRINMTDVIFTTIASGGVAGPDEPLSENVNFCFRSAEFVYSQPDGVVRSWKITNADCI